MEKLLLTAEEAALSLGIARTRVYYLIGLGEIESIKIGKSRRIPCDALTTYVASIRDEQRCDVA